MALFSLPSKLVGERIAVAFDFTRYLELNETITSWSCAAEVFTGVDPAPSQIIAKRRFLLKGVATQWISQGLPGVIYLLTATAVTSAGRDYVEQAKLAVLSSVALFPPLFGVLYTTTIYPVEVIESMDSTAIPLVGGTILPPMDEMNSSAIPLSGELRLQLIGYVMLPEAMDSTAIPLSGEIVTILLTTTMAPEAMDSAAVPLSGALVTILITYSNYPAEAMDSSAIPTGGVLT